MNYQKVYDQLITKHGSVKKPNTYSERHHIIPKCSGYIDCEDFDNKALSCTQCNKDFKGKWKPNSQSIDKIERTKYILEIRKFIEDKRAIKEKELDEIKKIFEAYFISNKITYSTKTKFNK